MSPVAHTAASVSAAAAGFGSAWLASPAASAVSLLTLQQAVLKGGMAGSVRSQQCEVPYF